MEGLIETKIKEILEFFQTHDECFPKANAYDELEDNLYNFRKKIDFTKYDISKELLKEYKEAEKIYIKSTSNKKKAKSFIRRQKNISKSIENYYNYYLENGYFPTNSKSSSEYEIKISKAYTNILGLKEFHTKKNKEMIDIISEIKGNLQNRKKLLIIKQYIDFYNKYGYVPTRKKQAPDKKNTLKSLEYSLANKYERLDLPSIKIPKILEIKLIKVQEASDRKEKLKDKVNSYMQSIILFMTENEATPYERDFRKYQIEYNGEKLNVSSALNFVDKNINLLDDNLIKTYNSFDFVKKKKEKSEYDLSKYLYHVVFNNTYVDSKCCVNFIDSLENLKLILKNGTLILKNNHKGVLNANELEKIEKNKTILETNKNIFDTAELFNQKSSWLKFLFEYYPVLILDKSLSSENMDKISLDYLIGIGLFGDNLEYDEFVDGEYEIKNKVDSIKEGLRDCNLEFPVINLKTGHKL